MSCARSSLVFNAEKYPIMCLYYILSILLSVNGPLSCFHLLAFCLNPFKLLPLPLAFHQEDTSNVFSLRPFPVCSPPTISPHRNMIHILSDPWICRVLFSRFSFILSSQFRCYFCYGFFLSVIAVFIHPSPVLLRYNWQRKIDLSCTMWWFE